MDAYVYKQGRSIGKGLAGIRLFAKMNYEKATQMEIAKACGLSKAGLVYYFPFKQDLFVAVVDKYVFHTQQLENKFQFTAGSFPEFIDQYIAGVERTMNNLGNHEQPRTSA